MWVLSIALSLGGLGLLALASRPWRGARAGDLGVMSQRWLTEHRAGSR